MQIFFQNTLGPKRNSLSWRFSFLLGWALPLAIFSLFFSRSDFYPLLVAFCTCLTFYALSLSSFKSERLPYRALLWAGLLLRGFFLFLPPVLSEDVFRFLWDGLLEGNGIVPYAVLPRDLEQIGFSEADARLGLQLKEEMNSAGFYSVYPPVLQFFFFLAGEGMRFFGSVPIGIGIWKGIVFGFEIATAVLVRLRGTEEHRENFLKYWMHPLVLLEGCGSGHPEPILIFFLFGFFFYRFRGKPLLTWIFYSAAILTKLIPLLLLPFLSFRLWQDRRKNGKAILALLVFLVLLVLGILLFGENLLPSIDKQWEKGIGVYFRLFEFHGGTYYLWKAFLRGTWFPYAAGIHLAILSAILISTTSYLRSRKTETLEKAAETWISVLGIYLLFSTTVHPWYILPLLAGVVFTNSLWPQAAAGIWILSYSTYRNAPYKDEPFFMILEYAFVLTVFFLEKRKLIDPEKVRW
ncbi:hypothetical protein EHO60_02185 [Leptospira fletcheri]|uniref:DUF2029 domain-containing protein n=1 Tax=Leptospira fletcheri TaxID=2484981 RepID=A0A4R9GK82_9LEPT|nr:hypothetical protein [Leptospira fletcheri]TGK13186.1 hypothetical protein EHO60_02185 [Leptospira fletcheri]